MTYKTVIDGIDYGPLAALIGTWQGDKGMDVAPDPDGIEHNPYYETIEFEAGGDLTNANDQKLVIAIYRQVVTRKADNKVFHHQIGYWNWDPQSGQLSQSLTIPRSFAALAGGSFAPRDNYAGALTFEVKSELGHADWGIVQSPYLRDKAKTLFFNHKLTVDGDTLAYFESTGLHIYGKTFDHTDTNTLKRVK